MIFQNLTFSVGLRSSFFTKLKPSFMFVRFFQNEVRHNSKKHIFYVTLDDLDKQAILHYKIDGKIMDLRAINIPHKFKGRGIARLLTETAFTYAIINDYYLYLTCSYTQKFYLANKNLALENRIVGPKQILNVPVSIDPSSFDKLPDPEDSINDTKKT